MNRGKPASSGDLGDGAAPRLRSPGWGWPSVGFREPIVGAEAWPGDAAEQITQLQTPPLPLGILHGRGGACYSPECAHSFFLDFSRPC